MSAQELKAKAAAEILMFEKLSKLTAISMVKMLMSQENKIAELEKEVITLARPAFKTSDIQLARIAELEKGKDELNIQIEVLKHSDAEYYGLYSELLFSPNEPPESLEAHNLEQQAKGVEDAKKYYSHKWVDEFEDVTVNIMKKGEGYIYPEGLGEYSSELYNQAKALKEGKQ
jgi:hypothetical protein